MKKPVILSLIAVLLVLWGTGLPVLRGAEPPQLDVHRAAELTWATTPGEQYRVYRSVGDPSHFFPWAGPLTGDGAERSLFDSTRSPREAFYRLHVVPTTPSPQELLALQQAFGDAVDAKDVEQIGALFGEDTRFDSPPTPAPMNRDELKDWFAGLFVTFPDYSDTEGLRLAAENIVMIEHIGQGTQTGDLDMGDMGTVPPTGQITLMPHIGVFEYEGDKVFRYTVYNDIASMLVQLGVFPASELPPLEPSITLPDPVSSTLSSLEVVSEARARWNGKNLGEYVSRLAADADLLFAPMGAALDRSSFAALQEIYWLAFPDLQSQSIRTVDLGDGWVLSELAWQGTNTGPYFGLPATGRPFQLRVAELSRVDASGLITVSHFYWDNVTLLAQLGLLQ